MEFYEEHPSTESYWRSIILFGRNVASYKFALAKSLLELASTGKTFLTLEELAVPFSMAIAEHLKNADRQATAPSSQFLDACRQYNRQEITKDQLIDRTVALGFNNVIDAFHVVNQGDVPIRFYEDQRKGRTKGIVLTDELLRLKGSIQYQNLPIETEARWRLVETAWRLGVSKNLLEIGHDDETGNLYIEPANYSRVDITSSRDALNGYQKGKCFYCFSDISVEPTSIDLADVDHFHPHTLSRYLPGISLDGVWNLVLACKECNRGTGGKFALVPKLKYLERLHRRNSFLIESHHPLRETLIMQTGSTEHKRRQFLQKCYDQARSLLIHEWEPTFEYPAVF